MHVEFASSSLLKKIAALMIALCCLQGFLTAQDITCEVESRGRFGHIIDLETKEATVLELLSTLSAKTDLGMRFDSAELTDRLDQQSLTINLVQVPLAELLDLLGGAAGAHIEIDRKAELIKLSEFPAADSATSPEFLRKKALDSVLSAFGDSEAGEADLLLQTAELQIAGNEFNKAVETYQSFFFPKDDDKKSQRARHPDSVDALLRAGRCALAASRAEEAWGFYDHFVVNYPRHERLPEAHLLGAESRIQAESWAEAIRILRSLERAGSKRQINERDAILAELLLAETYWRIGEFKRSLEILEAARIRHTPTHADLLGQIPLYAGLSRRADGQLKKSVYEFRVASMSCPTNELRRRSVEEQARTLLELKSPFEALTAVRVALQMDPENDELFRFRRLQAAAYRGLGLHEKALSTLEETAANFEELMADAPRRRDAAIDLMKDIAEIRFDRREFGEAAAFFASLESRKELRRHARLMRARSYFAAQKWREAIEITENMGALGDDEELALEIRRLRGDSYMKLGLYELAIAAYQDV